MEQQEESMYPTAQPEESGMYPPSSGLPTSNPPLDDPDMIKNRATVLEMANQAIGLTADPEEIAFDVAEGREDSQRVALAGKVENQFNQWKLNTLNELFKDPEFKQSPEAVDRVISLTQNEVGAFDDKQLAERLYGEEIIRRHTTASIDKAEAVLENPRAIAELDMIGAGMLANRQVLSRKIQEYRQRRNLYYDRKKDDDGHWTTMSSAEMLGEIRGSALPFLAPWITRSSDKYVDDSGSISKTLGLPSSDAMEEIQAIMSLPPDQFEAAIDERLSEIENAGFLPGSDYMLNISAAEDWLMKFQNYGISQMQLDDVFTVADIGLSSYATIGRKVATAAVKGGIKVTGAEAAAARYKDSLTTLIRGAYRTETYDEAAQATVMGDIDRAAKIEITRKLKEGGFTEEAPVEELLSSFYSHGHWFQSSRILTPELKRRMAQDLTNDSTYLVESLFRGLKIDRLSDMTDEVAQTLVDSVANTHRKKYTAETDQLMDITPIWDQATNTYKADVIIGKPDATGFKERWQAANFAKRNGYHRAEVERVGDHYFVKSRVDVDETDGVIRDAEVPIDQVTPRSRVRTAVGAFFEGIGMDPNHANKFTGADNLVSAQSAADRKTAILGINNLMEYVRETSKNLGKIGRKNRRKLEKFIDEDRKFEKIERDPDTGHTRQTQGRWANSAREFEERWIALHGKRPHQSVYGAYQDWRRLNDLDYTFRNFGLYRDKVRKGLEQYTLKRPKSLEGAPWGDVEGKLIEDLPWENPKEAGILVVADEGLEFFRKNANKEVTREVVQQRLKEGWKIIQVSPTGQQQLFKDSNVAKAANGENVDFVMVRQFESKPLGYQQIPYKEGGHVVYEEGFYVGSPKITRLERGDQVVYRYDKDVNLFHFTNGAQARKVAGLLDEARQMIKRGEDITSFVQANFAESVQDIKGLFLPQVDRQGVVVREALLDIDQKIGARMSGENLGELQDLKTRYGSQYETARDNPYNLYNEMGLEYTGQRNAPLKTLSENEEAPLFASKQAQYLSVGATMQRSLRHILNSRFYDDMRIKEATKFAKEFKHLLDVPEDELLANPIKHLMDPKWKTGNVNADDLVAAKGANMALRNFMGQTTATANVLKHVKHKLLDSIYGTFGDGKVLDFIEPVLLHSSSDPARVLRSLAFHTKLGLFNPIQLLLQSSSFAHVAALAGPVDATKAFSGYTFMRYLGFNTKDVFKEEVYRHVKALGWKREHFIEAHQLQIDSGMAKIGGEVSVRSDYFETNIIQGKFNKFLDYGTMFFNEGERFVRSAAMNAAYLGWRKANPTAKLTNKAKQDILNQADLMSVNMTAASNAVWQRGLMSIPTQFWAYQARLMDQVLGKRLTGAQRARLAAVYGVLWGFPTAASGALGFIPFQDILKTELESRNIAYDENMITRGLMSGWVSVILEGLSGERLDTSRYGPNGIATPWDWLMGEADGNELLFGASGSVFGDVLQGMMPLAGDVARTMMGEGPSKQVVLDHVERLAGEISGSSNLIKWYYANALGKYVSKRGTEVGELTQKQGFINLVSGMMPEELSKNFRRRDILKAEKLAKAEAKKIGLKWLRRAFNESDVEARGAFLDEANVHLRVIGEGDPQWLWEVYRESLKENQTSSDRIWKEWTSSSSERMETEIRRMQDDALGR